MLEGALQGVRVCQRVCWRYHCRTVWLDLVDLARGRSCSLTTPQNDLPGHAWRPRSKNDLQRQEQRQERAYRDMISDRGRSRNRDRKARMQE